MKVEIKKWLNDAGKEVNAIFIDDEVFDWDMDEQSLKKAKHFCQEDSNLKKSITGDIQNHFLESFSEFIGKKVTLADVNKAIKLGCI